MKKIPALRLDGAVAYTPESHEVFPTKALTLVRNLKRDARLRNAFLKKSGIFGSDGKVTKAYASDCSHLY